MAAKVKFEERNVMGDTYTAVVFDQVFSCKVLSNEGGVLSVERFAASVETVKAIQAMCDCFEELEVRYGVREIKIALNQVDLTITAENAKNPKEIFFHLLRQLA